LTAGKGRPVAVGLAVAFMVVLAFPCVYTTVQAQTETKRVFSAADTFDTPDFNSSIRFAVNGSCTAVTLANGVWTFTNLRLNNSQTLNNFSISVKDANITINSLRTSNFTGRSTFIRYTATGEGTQTVDLDTDSTRRSHWSEWSIIVPRSGNYWPPEGQNWKLQPDNTVIVWGLTGNVSVSHYVFLGAYSDSSLPFYLQHSLAIVTAAVLATIVAATLVIQITLRRRQ
jgi:hypothetical protein